jgi:hypothetical protein
MEIHDRGPSKVERVRADAAGDVIDLTRPNRESIAESVREAEQRLLEQPPQPTPASNDRGDAAPAGARGEHATRADAVEVSSAARALSEGESADEAARRRQQVERMRAERDADTLADRARAERAAEKLLGG